MQEVLIRKLHNYMGKHNPDLLLKLQQEQSVTDYLKEKVMIVDSLLNELIANNTPSYIIEQQCMDVLTGDLRPSKYDYIIDILQEEFKDHYQRLVDNGILITEVINIIQSCEHVFTALKFSEESEDDRFLRYAVSGAILEYLESSVVKEM